MGNLQHPICQNSAKWGVFNSLCLWYDNKKEDAP